MTNGKVLGAACAALALAAACATPAAAAIDRVDFTVHSGQWIHLNGATGPYGLSNDPTVSGFALVDDSKNNDPTGIVGLSYATGTRTWTLGDVGSASGAFFSGGSFVALNLFFTTPGNVLGTNNTAVIGEGPNTLYCNGCVTVDSVRAVPEPATWALAIIGFGAAGTALRRRRTAVARA